MLHKPKAPRTWWGEPECPFPALYIGSGLWAAAWPSLSVPAWGSLGDPWWLQPHWHRTVCGALHSQSPWLGARSLSRHLLLASPRSRRAPFPLARGVRAVGTPQPTPGPARCEPAPRAALRNHISAAANLTPSSPRLPPGWELRCLRSYRGSETRSPADRAGSDMRPGGLRVETRGRDSGAGIAAFPASLSHRHGLRSKMCAW